MVVWIVEIHVWLLFWLLGSLMTERPKSRRYARSHAKSWSRLTTESSLSSVVLGAGHHSAEVVRRRTSGVSANLLVIMRRAGRHRSRLTRGDHDACPTTGGHNLARFPRRRPHIRDAGRGQGFLAER